MQWPIFLLAKCNWGAGWEPLKIFEILRWACSNNFLKLCKKKLHLNMLITIRKWWSLKLRVFFKGSCCCYGNVLPHENDLNFFYQSLGICLYHFYSINWKKVVLFIHQKTSAKNCWKLLSATLPDNKKPSIETKLRQA